MMKVFGKGERKDKERDNLGGETKTRDRARRQDVDREV